MRCQSSCAITDGVSSSATRTRGASRSLNNSSGSPPAAQVHAQAADDVADISLPLAKVGILRLIEERGDLVQRPLERRAGVEALRADDVGRRLDQHGVVEHQQLRVEQIGVFGAGRRGDALADLLAAARATGGALPRAVPARARPGLAGSGSGRSRAPRLSTSALPIPMPGDTPSPVTRMAPRPVRAR